MKNSASAWSPQSGADSKDRQAMIRRERLDAHPKQLVKNHKLHRQKLAARF